jgi:hypothetical protein
MVFYIRLIIFLSISFKYYLFFFLQGLYFFLNIIFFNFWEKQNVEREIVGENLGKRAKKKKKTWEERDSGRKKYVKRKFRKIPL